MLNFLGQMGLGRVPCRTLPGNAQHNHIICLLVRNCLVCIILGWQLLIQVFVAENTPTEASEKVSLLAVAWDRKVQVAKLIKSELKVYGTWSLDSAAIGVAWLDDQVYAVGGFIVCLLSCRDFINNMFLTSFLSLEKLSVLWGLSSSILNSL